MKEVIALAGIVMGLCVVSVNKTTLEFPPNPIILISDNGFDEDKGLQFSPQDQIFIFDLDRNEKFPLTFDDHEDFWMET